MALRQYRAGAPLRREDFPSDALFFFDFDGVLASQVEEKVFRLDEIDGEREALESTALYYGIEPSLYPNTRYLRHLVFQGARGGHQIEPHKEMLDFAQWIDDPFFIITARSGLYAVNRMMEFLTEHELEPQEVFCLGRASKGHLLAELRSDWPGRPFVFFDDSKSNIDSAMALNDPLLTVVEVIWPTCTKEAERLLDIHLPL